MPRPMSDPLDAGIVGGLLEALSPRFEIRVRPYCDSTSSELLRQSLPSDGRIVVLATEVQTAGRGRSGRSWASLPGSSLTFSILWPWPHAPARLSGLSLVVGLGLLRAVSALGARSIRLKWPNDLICAAGKVAGILCEVRQPDAVVIGIGINVHRAPEAAVDAAALASCLSGPISRNALMARILEELFGELTRFAESGFGPFRQAWNAHHAYDGVDVCLKGVRDDAYISGICQGVDEDGALVVDTAGGRRHFLSGELSLRPT
ncbi:MAG: Bifunctional ligase/repressor BirA [Rhodocyclaceae bacterium]|nr:Bifunctional ligase/repressor BirA [Rhodocyclaceae bacterium]